MNGATFEGQMSVLAGFYNVLENLDLDDLRMCCDEAEALGPILDPTAYMDGADRLRTNRAVIEAAISLRDAFRKAKEEAK